MPASLFCRHLGTHHVTSTHTLRQPPLPHRHYFCHSLPSSIHSATHSPADVMSTPPPPSAARSGSARDHASTAKRCMATVCGSGITRLISSSTQPGHLLRSRIYKQFGREVGGEAAVSALVCTWNLECAGGGTRGIRGLGPRSRYRRGNSGVTADGGRHDRVVVSGNPLYPTGMKTRRDCSVDALDRGRGFDLGITWPELQRATRGWEDGVRSVDHPVVVVQGRIKHDRYLTCQVWLAGIRLCDGRPAQYYWRGSVTSL